VTAVASILEAPDPGSSPAVRFTRMGRIAVAGTLVLGATCQLIAFLTIPSYDETEDRLRWVAEHPDRAQVSKVFDTLAMPFLFGTALLYVLLARQRSPKLAYAGGVLLGCGMAGLTTTHGFEAPEFALVQDGRFSIDALADVADNVSTASVVVMLLLFIPGAFLGLLTMAVALWRSRAVPRGAVLMIPLFVLTDLFLQMGVLGRVIALVGATWIAVSILRASRGEPAPT
jgi:hypothetical protein